MDILEQHPKLLSAHRTTCFMHVHAILSRRRGGAGCGIQCRARRPCNFSVETGVLSGPLLFFLRGSFRRDGAAEATGASRAACVDPNIKPSTGCLERGMTGHLSAPVVTGICCRHPGAWGSETPCESLRSDQRMRLAHSLRATHFTSSKSSSRDSGVLNVADLANLHQKLAAGMESHHISDRKLIKGFVLHMERAFDG